jgi:hypothetical protein
MLTYLSRRGEGGVDGSNRYLRRPARWIAYNVYIWTAGKERLGGLGTVTVFHRAFDIRFSDALHVNFFI